MLSIVLKENNKNERLMPILLYVNFIESNKKEWKGVGSTWE